MSTATFLLLGTVGLAASTAAGPAIDCSGQSWLVIAPGVSGARCHSNADTPEAAADIDEAHPAEVTLRTIGERLRDRGWTPMREDFLTGGASSHVNGWGTFVDGTVTPDQDVRQWLGDWEDHSLNVVVYGLQYRTNLNEPVGQRRGRLVAKYLPCAVVEAMQREVGQLRPDQNRCAPSASSAKGRGPS